ncbi:MAG: hypothetical protein IT293_03720 [Deltaproteobacteria bacterium]|nr:hypothetical protein [Deltaproteobacteria bacterium]
MRGTSRPGVLVGVALVLILGTAWLLRRVNAERARDRGTTVATAPTAGAPAAPNARRTPLWQPDPNDPEPAEDLAYKADPLSPMVDPADEWARIDFDEMRRALPDNLYWKMAFPTKDQALIDERARIREQWNVEYGKVISNTATDQEIDAFYGEQQKISEDYLEWLVYLADHYGNLVPRSATGGLKLAGEMHLARLEEIPRKMAEAKERSAAHAKARQAWLEEQRRFASPAPPAQ